MDTGRRKLLLADDSLAIQKVVSLFFADEGVDVAAVSDGRQALEYLRENPPPDVVLADCFMPGVNGYELCERIKTDDRWRHIPVLLLVSIFEPFNEAEARRVGADDVLTKPFQSIRDLMSKVGSMFGGGQKAGPESADGEAAPPARAETPPQDKAASDPASAWEMHEGAPSSDASADAYLPDPASSFADLEMDDQMIKATPADNFGDTTKEQAAAEPVSQQPAFAETATGRDETMREAHAYVAAQEDVGEETLITERAGVGEPAAAAQAVAQPAFAARMASASAADDALLDLGDIDLPPTATADDFVLDLGDETPSASSAPSAYQWDSGGSASAFGGRESEPAASSVSSVSSVATHADTAGAFAEAAHGEAGGIDVEELRHAFEAHQKGRAVEAAADPQPAFSPPAEAPLPVGMGDSRSNRGAEGDVARPPIQTSVGGANSSSGAGSSSTTSPGASSGAGGGQITLDQLSPEVIDAIARRAVEQLSERVVQEIAWEVVPQLAELLIRQRLDEEKKK